MSHRRVARRPPRRRSVVAVEAVERRTLMSTVLPAAVHPDAVYLRTAAAAAAAGSDTVQGYTPAQIRAAYGFAGLTFDNGTVTADGTGQTIAIADAYNDPKIAADLATFDAQFGLAAPPTFKVVNQTGGATLPATDAGWAGEITLDVEWAHAVAPGANILLVEATTDSTDDLLAAVNYARTAPDVSTVSLSWGGSEYVSFGGGGETGQQLTYDQELTTPAGHQGVTFVAAAGDSGQQSGAQWPASSTDVVSVGGTTLDLAGGGTTASEIGWAGTSSGYSEVEAEPAYQQPAQTTGFRSVSDVGYDADPDTGVAVYDSVPDDGVSGWQEVGGTSAGTPQWAALIAVADQGRSIAGASTLNGTTQTLPDLYALYGDPGTAKYAGTYTADFNDITAGGAGTVGFGHHGGHGSSGTSAGAGYDQVTGLGTPKAASLIAALAGASAGTGTTTPTGSGGAASVTLSPVAVTLLSTPAPGVVGGAAGVLRVNLANTGDTAFAGPVTVTLYASTDTTASADDAVLTTLALRSLKLPVGGFKVVTLKYTYSAKLPTGDYYLVAEADATTTDTQPTTAATAVPVSVAAPVVDLSVAFPVASAVVVSPGKGGRATVRLTNLGNVTATGTVVADLYAGAEQVGTVTRNLKLAAGRRTAFAVTFTFPADLTPGDDVSLTAVISPTTSPADTTVADKTATVPTVAA